MDKFYHGVKISAQRYYRYNIEERRIQQEHGVVLHLLARGQNINKYNYCVREKKGLVHT